MTPPLTQSYASFTLCVPFMNMQIFEGVRFASNYPTSSRQSSHDGGARGTLIGPRIYFSFTNSSFSLVLSGREVRVCVCVTASHSGTICTHLTVREASCHRRCRFFSTVNVACPRAGCEISYSNSMQTPWVRAWDGRLHTLLFNQPRPQCNQPAAAATKHH